MQFLPLVKLHQLYDGFRQPFRINGMELLLIQEDGRTYLIENRCPHLGADLSRARIGAGLIHCSRHGMSFRLDNGTCVDNACSGRLRLINTVYDGNQLGVMV